MAIEVRIPTILRTLHRRREDRRGRRRHPRRPARPTWTPSTPACAAGWSPSEGGLHRFVNVYVNDEDVRFLGALDAKLDDGDTVTILPAVAGGAFGFAAAAALLGLS